MSSTPPTTDILSVNVSSRPDWTNSTFLSDPPASGPAILLLSGLFSLIGGVGVSGNLLVITAIVGDQRMRGSVTNLLIMNLAVSDLIIMVSCVPDIVQFVGNRGWRLGLPLCTALRFTEVFSLYASVMTLVSLCVERYIAIIHPIKAHILCSRTRILAVISVIWPTAMLCASPNLFLHVVLHVSPHFTPCVVRFPDPLFFVLFKYGEFLLFYLLPLVIQVTLYVHMGRRLFGEEVRRGLEPSVCKDKFDRTMRARKGVVKMLIAGVAVYFVSFSPHQMLLFYNTFSQTPFEETWSFLILVNVMAYASSACNPLLYSVFSHKFRQKLGSTMACGRGSSATCTTGAQSTLPLNSRNKNFGNKSLKTTVTEI